MLQDAEKFKEEDNANKQRIEAKNQYENTIYGYKGMQDDPKYADKISSDMKERLNVIIDKNVEWLDNNSQASTDEFKAKQSEFEEELKPLVMEMSGAQSGAMPDETGGTTGDTTQPHIEEVD